MLESRARVALAIFGFADRRLANLAIWTYWRGRRDLNPRLPVRQTGALTAELHPHKRKAFGFQGSRVLYKPFELLIHFCSTFCIMFILQKGLGECQGLWKSFCDC